MAEDGEAKRVVKPRVIGRYALFGEIAAGGMATVHFGRLVGPVGFSRTVAIKRLHAQFAKDPEFVAMFLDEARLASRIQHPNVVTTLDVVNMPNEVFLVMEYVQGESLSRLVKNARKLDEHMPPGHVSAVISGMLHGLHAAHEAKSERREPLNIVHRDISPQNVLIGTDGTARVLDFGVAKAAMRSQSTRDGQMKGKLSYMSPEQLNGKPVDRRTDLFAAGVVLWEALTGKRLFEGADAGEIFAKLLSGEIPEPKTVVEGISDAMNTVVMKALERDPDRRYQTARDFAIDLENSMQASSARHVGEWVERMAGVDLDRRAQLVAEVEAFSATPEDIEKLDGDEGIEAYDEIPEQQSVSAVKSVVGPRPRLLPPPPTPPRRRIGPDGEDLSAASVASSTTSQVSSLVVSQVSSATHSAPARRTLWIGGIAACVGGGVLAFLLFGRPGPQPGPVAAPAAQAPAPPAAVAPLAPPAAVAPRPASPTETVRVEDLPPAAPDEATHTPSAHGSPAPEGKHPVPAAGAAGKRPASAAGPGAKPAAVNCSPPFTIDANGIKRAKPGCL